MDVDAYPLEAVLVAGPAHGLLTLNADGSFTYVPDSSYAGPDQFTYKASDSVGFSEVATVSIDVLAVLVDLDLDSDNTGAIEGTPEEDLLEMSSPGKGARKRDRFDIDKMG